MDLLGKLPIANKHAVTQKNRDTVHNYFVIEKNLCILADLATSRAASGSMESLGSMGADSVITGVETANGEVRKPSRASTPQPRSPLQSSSSLELSPRMEQVIKT